MRRFLISLIALATLFGLYAMHATSRETKQATTQLGPSAASLVRELWVSYLVLQMTAHEGAAGRRVSAALQDHATSISESLGLIAHANSKENMDTLVFLGSLSLDGFMAEDLRCAVLSKGKFVKSYLVRASSAPASPCEDTALDLSKKSYVDSNVFVTQFCKGRGEFNDWARNLIDSIDKGDRCDLTSDPKNSTR